MDAPSIVALAIGVVAIVITIIGCAWNVSGKLSGMEMKLSSLETAVLSNGKKTEETHKLIRDHASECDTNRAELEVKAKTTRQILDDHGRRLGGMETT